MAAYKRRNKSAKSEPSINVNSTRLDLDGTPPWYLMTHTHSTKDQRMCSHLYLYGNTSKYGPDFTVAIKYDTSSDNIGKDPFVEIERHAY